MPTRENKPVLYLIDGSSYIFRAYHAIPHLSTRKGETTNAVLGFTNMLLKTLREGDSTHAVVAFDTKAPTFRHQRYEAYKANRLSPPDDLKSQIPRILEVVEALNLPMLREPGWEADDLLGTLALRAQAQGWDVVLVTGDKDFMQLIRPGIRMYEGMRDKWIGPDEVRARFGVAPAQVTDVLALIGDTSDNVPGVRGIGEKTAGPLIDRFGSVEALYEHLDEVSAAGVRKKLEAGRESALLSKELVTIRTDAPVPFDLEELVRREPHVERLRALFAELEFTRLAGELTPKVALVRDDYHLVTTAESLAALRAEVEAADVFAVDVVTTFDGPMTAELVGLTVCTRPGRVFYVPTGHRYLGVPAQLSTAAVLEALGPLLEDASRPKYVSDAKHDILVLSRHGLTLRGIAGDPLLFDYLLDPGKSSHLVGALAQTELGHSPASLDDLVGKGRARKTFDEVLLEAATPFACEDADCTFRLAERLAPRVREAGLWDVFEKIDQPLAPVLAHMERTGVRVDTALLGELSKEFEGRIATLEEEVYGLAGRRFLIGSTRQLAEVLFDELKLPVVKRTKTGPSTDVTVLEALAAEHPLPDRILAYRHLSKLKSTYVDALPLLVHPKTGRLHTRFSQTTAATGRLASSDPNLQNIPIRTEEGRRIRQAFVAEPGRVLVSADYSQIELRILAHLARDEAFAAAFREGQDIHARTASELLGVPLDGVTADHRRIAKAINFGIVYGMSAFRLARDLGIERREAKLYIDHYFERHAGVAAWLERTTEEARQEGMVRTLFGRRRLLPDIHSRNATARAAAERTAINTPIQGTAADVIKLAMLRVHEGLPAVSPEARMIMQVHDELLLEVPEAEAAAVAGWLRGTMESAVPLDVPLKVDVGRGPSWAEAH